MEISKKHSCIVFGCVSKLKRCGSLRLALFLIIEKGFRSFFDLLEGVLRKGSGYHVALFSTIAWSLWQRRNMLRENQSAWPFHEIGDKAKALVVEFLEPNK